MPNFNKVAEIDFPREMKAKERHYLMERRMLDKHSERMRKFNNATTEEDGSNGDYKEAYKAGIVDAAFGRLPC